MIWILEESSEDARNETKTLENATLLLNIRGAQVGPTFLPVENGYTSGAGGRLAILVVGEAQQIASMAGG